VPVPDVEWFQIAGRLCIHLNRGGALMTEAPVRPVRRSPAPPVVDVVETPAPVAETAVALPQTLLEYIHDQKSLILCERPASGGVELLRRLLVLTHQRIVLVVDDPLQLIDAVPSTHLICDADSRFCFRNLAADAFRYLQSQLSSEQAELHADLELIEKRSTLQTQLEVHRQHSTTLPQRAEQTAQQSAEWAKQLESQQKIADLKSQVEALRTQLAQPVGFFQRVMGRGPSPDQQKQLTALEAELHHATSQTKPDTEVHQGLLAKALDRLRLEEQQRDQLLKSELDALPLPKLNETERHQMQHELDARQKHLASAAEEFVWAQRRMMLVKPDELAAVQHSGRFDKWILDVAQPTADTVRQCNRLAPSGIFLGDVPTLRPPGYRNGALPHEPTIFEQTWNEHCTDGWAIEGTRFLAQVVPLNQRAELKPEAVIGTEQHEARLHDNGTELVLAEVAFASETTIASAARFLIEQAELPCLTTIGNAIWTHTDSTLIATWFVDDEATCDTADEVRLSFSGSILSAATFPVSRFPNQSDAVVWLAKYTRCTAPVCIRTRVG
jgi:hypothetical protein